MGSCAADRLPNVAFTAGMSAHARCIVQPTSTALRSDRQARNRAGPGSPRIQRLAGTTKTEKQIYRSFPAHFAAQGMLAGDAGILFPAQWRLVRQGSWNFIRFRRR